MSGLRFGKGTSHHEAAALQTTQRRLLRENARDDVDCCFRQGRCLDWISNVAQTLTTEMYVYVCMYVCIMYYVLCMYVCMYYCVCVYYVCMYVCMHVCVYVCIYICTYVCVCVCVSTLPHYQQSLSVTVSHSIPVRCS
jgi:hypothetical protein